MKERRKGNVESVVAAFGVTVVEKETVLGVLMLQRVCWVEIFSAGRVCRGLVVKCIEVRLGPRREGGI